MAQEASVKAAAVLLAVFLILSSAPVVAVEQDIIVEDPKVIMVFGDSLSSGYGLPMQENLPVRLGGELQKKGYDVSVMNAGVAGDTTSGGLTRLKWTLKEDPDYVILALGGNDMLRAVDPAITRENLKKMLQLLKENNKPVLLVGMKALSNLGPEYVTQYDAMYRELAAEFGTLYVPFLLEGVALDPVYNQADGVHPNVAGVAVMIENVMPQVEELLKAEKKRK